MLATWNYLPPLLLEEEEETELKMAMEEELKDSDELLTPLAKLKKYADSDNVFERQAVVRSVLDTLRNVVDCPEDVETVVGVLWKLSDDIEPTVRAQLMEQVPHIAGLCHEYRGRLFHIGFQFLLPVVVNYLQDPNNQVRKASQETLLVMLEQDLVDKGLVEDQVCPVILRLTDQESFEDFRIEAVALIGKLAPMIGKEITERLFLKTFANLCVDSLFHVRKMCAVNFGIICSVLAGNEGTEKILLSRFSYLCEDGVWNVRKACADVFTTVSYTCSLETRHTQLASLFVNLLRDQSRWVRSAAFQALGPFISTFADPTRTGLYFSDDGSHIIRDNRFFEEDVSADEEDEGNLTKSSILNEEDALINNNETSCQSTNCDNQNDSSRELTVGENTTSNSDEKDVNNPKPVVNTQTQCLETSRDEGECEKIEHPKSEKQTATTDRSSADVITRDPSSVDAHSHLSVRGDTPGHLHIHLDESAFNSFHYWRIPIPELELDIDIVEGKPISVNVKATYEEQHGLRYSSQLNVNLSRSDEISDTNETISFGSTATGSFVFGSDSMQDQTLQSSQENISVDKLVNDTNNVSEPISFTRIRTASVGMVQENTEEGVTSDKILMTNANEAIVTSLHGIVTDVKQLDLKQSYAKECNSNWLESMECRQIDPSAYRVGNSNETYSPISNEVKKHILKQEIVPGELLEHYVTMSETSQIHSVDNEITRFCAYSLPAVAMTLGRRNWPILKILYEKLVSDFQWKVRRTLAFSIHELAMILGEDLAYKDLLPIFNGFIKDVDEVRIGVLQHIADFLKLLHPQERRNCLPKLGEFLKTDNYCNWRFRLELAEQLGFLATLYTPIEVRDYLMPLAMLLIADRVSEVRQVAARIISTLIREMNAAGEPSLVKGLIAELAEQFAHHKKWVRRQTFSWLCHHLLSENAMSLQQFAHDLLPHLLDLSYDPVPNVRLSVAKTLSQTIIPLDYYSSHHNPYHEVLIDVLRRLQIDNDRDVRFYAKLAPQHNYNDGSSDTQLVLPV